MGIPTSLSSQLAYQAVLRRTGDISTASGSKLRLRPSQDDEHLREPGMAVSAWYVAPWFLYSMSPKLIEPLQASRHGLGCGPKSFDLSSPSPRRLSTATSSSPPSNSTGTRNRGIQPGKPRRRTRPFGADRRRESGSIAARGGDPRSA